MSWYEWRPYVSVGERRRQAARKVADLRKNGQTVMPIRIEGRTIASSFWGKSWCTNLERYSDYETRLPRGRSYVRNGCVIDLQIARGTITASVMGSDLYRIKISIKGVAEPRWRSICRDCAGTIDSVVELLQGRLAKSVMDRVCREGDGLFPAPDEIGLSCSCPDWADMCKHVAAALYGVGARLDEQPQLLFVLRGVDQSELLARAGGDLAGSKTALAPARVLDDGDVAALFGIDLAEPDTPLQAALPAAEPTRPRRSVAAGKPRLQTKPSKTKSQGTKPSQSKPAQAKPPKIKSSRREQPQIRPPAVATDGPPRLTRQEQRLKSAVSVSRRKAPTQG